MELLYWFQKKAFFDNILYDRSSYKTCNIEIDILNESYKTCLYNRGLLDKGLKNDLNQSRLKFQCNFYYIETLHITSRIVQFPYTDPTTWLCTNISLYAASNYLQVGLLLYPPLLRIVLNVVSKWSLDNL